MWSDSQGENFQSFPNHALRDNFYFYKGLGEANYLP